MKGHCQCKAVTLEIADTKKLHACHCGICRRLSNGGPSFTITCDKNPISQGHDMVQHYASSEWAERGFCQQCGTPLYYHLLGTEQYFVSVGLFQENQEFEINSQIFIDDKPDFYTLANQTPMLTGEEVMAMYSNDTPISSSSLTNS
ncbi:GFA family protein [Pelistega sp. MC2]|uniref:GFA family protein n=1 Tax=Pelistega sp. MC2 TaxID=1720297 RepID=UPI0008D9BF18|nr:GFA family protein [Pelistega sp. MC2]